MSTLQQRFSNHYSDAPERLQAYEIPERGEPGKAAGLLLPASESEVGEMLRTANETGARLVISSGRTGLVEAQRPEGEIVLSLEKLQQPLSFSLADGRSFDFETGLAPEAHGDAQGAAAQAHRPGPLEGRVYFEPSEHGAEAGMAARIRRGRPTSDPRRPRDSD